MPWICFLLIFALLGTPALLPALDYRPEGFGAGSKGGTGGQVLTVTRLDDNPKRPVPGSLRWAVLQKGAREVKFAIAGTISLQDSIEIEEPFLTIDGSDAPGGGICIRGGSLEFKGTHDIIVRHVRIRLGDQTTLRRLKASGRDRPKDSGGLDCITLSDSRRLMFDHCSLSWSCDEIFGITRCQEVTIQWCILGEPLSNPRLHPYGDHHAFALNCSASTLTLHHCLLARFVMRGPQFECNDMRPKSNYTVRMEAVNNIIFDYQRSGSRFSTGVEPGSGTGKGKSFRFQFLNNLYITSSLKPPAIEPIEKYGDGADVQVGVEGNQVIARPATLPSAPRPPLLDHKGGFRPALPIELGSGHWTTALLTAKPIAWATEGGTPKGVSARTLFQAPTPVTMEPVNTGASRVLAQAGHRLPTDAVDARILMDAMLLRFQKPLTSQDEVGGWPDLEAGSPPRVGR